MSWRQIENVLTDCAEILTVVSTNFIIMYQYIASISDE